MTGSVLPSSFRDPSGFVFLRDGILYRQVNLVHREHYDRLLASGLYERLVSDGSLVTHQEADLFPSAPDLAYKVLRPERVPFVSYPFEWCFGQLKAAALVTLAIQRTALDFGMSLRDASAYNIQFLRGRPTHIDTLSFETLREGEPWVAYRQFCQHFLAPLVLSRYRDARLGQLSRVHLDGVPLDLAAGLLPWRARVHPPLLLHLFLHARTQRRHERTSAEAAQGNATGRKRRPFTIQAFQGLVRSLERAVRGLRWEPGRSVWAGYYGEAESYATEAMDHKRQIVADFVEQADPKVVWDLGANTGLFSRIAADRGATAVSFDLDPGAVEANYRTVVERGETNVLPLVQDLTNPSPSIGWQNRERLSLLERGPADMTLALALVHHLAIGNNVPLGVLADFLRQTCTWLAVEFVPKTDPKVKLLLATRDDVFPDYTAEEFERQFERRFAIDRHEPIKGSERVLYLMRGR